MGLVGRKNMRTDIAIDRHPCAFTPGGANEEFCVSQSRMASRNVKCAGCDSKWRVCTECAKVPGFNPKKSVVTDHATGLCSIHLQVTTGRGTRSLATSLGVKPYSGRVAQPIVPVVTQSIEPPAGKADKFLQSLSTTPTSIVSIPISKIRPRSDQPRHEFDEEALNALATGIKEVGQQQPAYVVKIPEDASGHEYELDDGERRWRACKIAGLDELKCIIVTEQVNTELRYMRSVVLNFNREEHTLLERVDMVVRLIDEFEFSQAAVARAIGKHPVWVNQHYGLRRLHPEVRALLRDDQPRDKRLSFQGALRLAPLDHELQRATAPSMIGAGSHAHTQVIRNVAAHSGAKFTRRRRAPKDDWRSIVRAISTAFGRIDVASQISDADWENAFKGRGRDEITKVLKEADDLINLMNLLRNRLGVSGATGSNE